MGKCTIAKVNLVKETTKLSKTKIMHIYNI